MPLEGSLGPIGGPPGASWEAVGRLLGPPGGLVGETNLIAFGSPCGNGTKRSAQRHPNLNLKWIKICWGWTPVDYPKGLPKYFNRKIKKHEHQFFFAF